MEQGFTILYPYQDGFALGASICESSEEAVASLNRRTVESTRDFYLARVEVIPLSGEFETDTRKMLHILSWFRLIWNREIVSWVKGPAEYSPYVVTAHQQPEI